MGQRLSRHVLYFTAPYQVAVRPEALGGPGPGQLLVQALVSAISPGTELLIYRGEAPTEMAADETITALAGTLTFPLKYGYAVVGRVVAVGAGAEEAWCGRLVFAFHPHASHFLASPEELFVIPPTLAPEEAVFLPNMETAVNFVMDGQPLIGERVVVFGQGVVGLLTTALLARFPLTRLLTVDRYAKRREQSLALGAQEAVDAVGEEVVSRLRAYLRGGDADAGADLAYELSGNPAALDQAIAATAFDGRVVIGSWYGRKRADVDLGGTFHRSRIRLISSQVSTLAPVWTGRWTKTRRLQVAWQMLAQVRPAPLITHRIPFIQAHDAYALLDRQPQDALQVLLTYEH